MDTKLSIVTFLAATLFCLPRLALGATITENDSTQPRGALEGNVNDQGQPLDPILEGFRAPARFDGEITPEEDSKNPYRDWTGSIMANATRDPAFFATLNVANHDLINLVKSLSDPALADFLAANGLDGDVHRDAEGNFQCLSDECLEADSPEDLLPIAGDLCLRCHTPAGWMEAHSEPPTTSFPFLRGQFWGAAFPEEPVDEFGHPKPFEISIESEAEMEGVQCDFCHRAKDNYKRASLYDGSTMAAGNGGFFVERLNPFGGLDGVPKPGKNEVFQKSGTLCGTCHDVTNPLIKTMTVINGQVPDMLHPMERTYTEWFWSGFRGKKPCQECHKPMRFVGAQTWLLYPGLDMLWGDLDQKWLDRGFDLTTPRSVALMDAMREDRRFMKSAARIQIVDSPKKASADEEVTITVRVTNRAGHKLPTGYAEGRQMWIHIVADDKNGTFFTDGSLSPDGSLERSEQTKVYEQVIKAEGYESSLLDDGHSILDADKDGVVSEHEKEFHFVLMNTVVKDNRIPPKGFNKTAYQADGAFIIPEDLYQDGQYWDDTPYTFAIPAFVKGNVRVTATLLYQTFNKEYIEFLATHDLEPTVDNGGRARNLPAGGIYADSPTWGTALHELWHDVGMGPPVEMGKGKFEIEIK
jgi:hypothetical protein